jgi:hypothetical protein
MRKNPIYLNHLKPSIVPFEGPCWSMTWSGFEFLPYRLVMWTMTPRIPSRKSHDDVHLLRLTEPAKSLQAGCCGSPIPLKFRLNGGTVAHHHLFFFGGSRFFGKHVFFFKSGVDIAYSETILNFWWADRMFNLQLTPVKCWHHEPILQ